MVNLLSIARFPSKQDGNFGDIFDQLSCEYALETEGQVYAFYLQFATSQMHIEYFEKYIYTLCFAEFEALFTTWACKQIINNLISWH